MQFFSTLFITKIISLYQIKKSVIVSVHGLHRSVSPLRFPAASSSSQRVNHELLQRRAYQHG